jgi:hypothetical protein
MAALSAKWRPIVGPFAATKAGLYVSSMFKAEVRTLSLGLWPLRCLLAAC